MSVRYIRDVHQLSTVENILLDFDGVFYFMSDAFKRHGLEVLVKTVYELGTPLFTDQQGRLRRLSLLEALGFARQSLTTWGSCFAGFQHEHGFPIKTFLEEYARNFNCGYAGQRKITPDQLHACSLNMAIASNSSGTLVKRMLKQFEMMESVEQRDIPIIGREHIDYLSKPDPEAYRRILKELPFWDVATTMTADDSMKNLKVAREQIGLMTAHIIHGQKFDPDKIPDFIDVVVDSLDDLFSLIEATKAGTNLKLTSSSCPSRSLRAGQGFRPAVR